MTAAAALSLDDVRIAAGDAVLVDGLALSVASGEIVALVAPSGAGKTTTLRAVVRLADLAGGTVRVGATPIDALPAQALRRRVALVAQHPVMLGPTVADEIALGAGGPVDEDAVAAALAEVGLPGGFASRASAELSGGEQARLAVARALAGSPEVLLLDEPSAALDRQAMLHLAGALRARAEAGLAVLVVTHDPAFLEAIGARIVELLPAGGAA